jgi:hypothetical protein
MENLEPFTFLVSSSLTDWHSLLLATKHTLVGTYKQDLTNPNLLE